MKNKNTTRVCLLTRLAKYGLCIWFFSLALLLAGSTVSAAPSSKTDKTGKKSTGTASRKKNSKNRYKKREKIL